MESPHWLLILINVAVTLLIGSAWLAVLGYFFLKWTSQTDATYRSRVKKWADENGFVIINQKRCYGLTPWLFAASGCQFVYRITVTRAEYQNYARWAWARCGGWLLGPKSEKLQVSWDGPWRKLSPPEPAPEPAPAVASPQDHVLWDRWIDG
jgi:hypothetical protein